MDYSTIKRWTSGDSITATRLNSMSDAIRRSMLQVGQYQDGQLNLVARSLRRASEAGTQLVAAVIFEEVPPCTVTMAGTYPDFTVTIDHGFLENAGFLLEETDYGWEVPLVGEYETIEFIAVANMSRSMLRGSETHPVILLGYVRDILVPGESGEEPVSTFVPANWDMSSLELFDSVSQIPFHTGNGQFRLDAGGCGS